MGADTATYQLLPFQFRHWRGSRFLLVNEVGDYCFLSRDDFSSLIGQQLNSETKLFRDLKGKHFLATEADLPLAIELLANKYRTRKGFLRDFTSLHMLVVTLRCNQDCQYCQVSAESDQAYQFDMKPDMARKIVDRIFEGPSENIKIEFQGGEPTLNWPSVSAAVEQAEKINESARKNLSFVVCTNLSNITLEQLEYCRDHKICISTSLDGPAEIHNKHRLLRNSKDTYTAFTKNLELTRQICGSDAVSALMTTTRDSLNKLPEIVDEYLRFGFQGVFFRSLNPYGLAAQNKVDLGYSAREWLEAYKSGLDYIISKNIEGRYFPEHFTTLLLTRILTPFSTGFVDLQSPAGVGISGAIYDYNGDVYPADEARMLARMGNNHFLIGNVTKSSFAEIFGGKKLREIIQQSNVEVMPYCSSCAYQTYCGVDPVRNYLETGDIVGRRPDSDFCEKAMGAFDILFEKLEREDERELEIFWSWITRRPLKQEVEG